MRIVVLFFCALTILTGERVSADSSLFAPYTQQAYPDLRSVNGDVVYTSGADALSITAYAESITFSPGVVELIYDVPDTDGFGDFSINANISAGAALDGQAITGKLSIAGTVRSTMPASGPLLTGDLFAFRSTGGDQMEFLYRITGGAFAGLYGGLDAVGFVVLGGTGFLGDFNSDFDNYGIDGFGTAVADTFAASVPEPGSLLLAVFGAVGLAGAARFRRRNLKSAGTVGQSAA